MWDVKSGELLIPNYFAVPREALVEEVVSKSTSPGINHYETINETLNTDATPRRQELQSRYWPSVPQKDKQSAKEEDSGKVNFVDRYWADHSTKWTHAIREIHPRAIVFLQPSVFAPPPSESLLSSAHIQDGRAAYSPHFYDGLTISTSALHLWLSPR